MKKYAFWGAIPSVVLLNAYRMIDMPESVAAFLVGVGIASLIGQGVSLVRGL